MKSAIIGSPTLAKPFDVEGQKFLFPLSIEVESKSPRHLVDPDSKLNLDRYGKQEITVISAEQLQRLITNLESTAENSGYKEIVELRFQQSDAKEEAKEPEKKPEAVSKKPDADVVVEEKPKPKADSKAKSAKSKSGSNK